MPERAGATAATERLFFALWPPADAAEALAARARALARESGGRITRIDSIHLTLVFLGDVAATWVPVLSTPPASVSVPSFDLVLDGIGVWRHNGIGWIAPATPPAALTALQGRLAGWLAGLGLRQERRAFRPHVTLVRKATAYPPERSVPAVGWSVDAFVLVRSAPDAGGRRYEVLGRFPLNEPGPGAVGGP